MKTLKSEDGEVNKLYLLVISVMVLWLSLVVINDEHQQPVKTVRHVECDDQVAGVVTC